MKSVGEVMAIGRTFQESFQKAIRGLETGVDGLTEIAAVAVEEEDKDKLRQELRLPGADRIWFVADAFRQGFSLAEVGDLTGIDLWFLAQIEDLVNEEKQIRLDGIEALDADRIRGIKRKGFSDSRVAALLRQPENL